jgi:hypothetical protein
MLLAYQVLTRQQSHTHTLSNSRTLELSLSRTHTDTHDTPTYTHCTHTRIHLRSIYTYTFRTNDCKHTPARSPHAHTPRPRTLIHTTDTYIHFSHKQLQAHPTERNRMLVRVLRADGKKESTHSALASHLDHHDEDGGHASTIELSASLGEALGLGPDVSDLLLLSTAPLPQVSLDSASPPVGGTTANRAPSVGGGADSEVERRRGTATSPGTGSHFTERHDPGSCTAFLSDSVCGPSSSCLPLRLVCFLSIVASLFLGVLLIGGV